MALSEERRRQALEILGASPSDNPRMSMSPERRAQALKILNPQEAPAEIEPSEELSFMDKAAQTARGIPNAIGNMADLVASGSVPFSGTAPGESLGLMMSGKSPQEIQDTKAQHNPNLSVERKLTHGYDELYGKNLEPSDTAGKVRQGIGSFLSPDPFTKYTKVGKFILRGGKAAAKGLKEITKHFGQAVGASTAINAPGHITEEGGVGRAAEDIGRGILGGMAGRSAATPWKTLKSAGKSIAQSPGEFSAKALSLGTHPEKEVLALAEKHGIELPHNIGTGTGAGAALQDFLANNYLSKSIFSSEKYKQAQKKANDAMLAKVKNATEELSGSTLKPSEASGEFKHFAKKQERKAQKQATELYDHARSFLTEADKIKPIHTTKTIHDLEKILDTPIRGADNKTVTKHLAELAADWKITKNGKQVGIFEPGDLAKWENHQYNRENLQEMFKKLKVAAHDVPTEEFSKAMSGINSILGSKDTKGVKNLLKGLKGAIAKDLETSTNKEFLEANKAANEFYRKKIGIPFRTKEARSVLRDEGSVEAFSKMNTVEGIRKLEKMVGKNKEGIEKLNALKKQKAMEIFESAMVGTGENKKLSHASFAKLFDKKPGKQEVLEKLIGRKQYDDLSEIAKISESFSAHGKNLLNSSDTAITKTNITEGTAVASGVLSFLFGSATLSTLAGSAGVVVTPYTISRIMSNPNIIKQARIYALAREQGNDKYAKSIMQNLVKMISKESSSIKTAGLNTLQPKEGENK